MTPSEREYLQDARAEYVQRLQGPDRAAEDTLLGHEFARQRIAYLDRALQQQDD
ncbi:hypothetical protein [Brachybacterium tyrofermentans]|uniref:hypothetical protein n=1 Tax=Brachybacterium tyrofermentans TaxID=47848 RepID=UPI001868D18D|nr:hypothetical protein [Brachybacterium tyrofermentans]